MGIVDGEGREVVCDVCDVCVMSGCAYHVCVNECVYLVCVMIINVYDLI